MLPGISPSICHRLPSSVTESRSCHIRPLADLLCLNKRWEENCTWLEMRSSHTERAIWMALGLCVTEMATWLAWVTASLKTCSYLFWLSTAPMFTIFGSQPARAQEHQRSTASRNRRIVRPTKRHHDAARSLSAPVAAAATAATAAAAARHHQLLLGSSSSAAPPVECATAEMEPGGRREGWGGGSGGGGKGGMLRGRKKKKKNCLKPPDGVWKKEFKPLSRLPGGFLLLLLLLRVGGGGRCSARFVRAEHSRCVAGWSIQAQRLLSLVLTAVHARRGDCARSRRISSSTSFLSLFFGASALLLLLAEWKNIV
ncbi:hypothetical protein EYF80_046268 [Liparis tanakae]|uniref:Uncharacterized protein n=1 Tax=Liparis tanakae TaxID=230148 RepID=A0A4Z2FQN7_9TELE|nr:hypothetical protein EYF80_046268 [Liparis tanakae]